MRFDCQRYQSRIEGQHFQSHLQSCGKRADCVPSPISKRFNQSFLCNKTSTKPLKRRGSEVSQLVNKNTLQGRFVTHPKLHRNRSSFAPRDKTLREAWYGDLLQSFTYQIFSRWRTNKPLVQRSVQHEQDSLLFQLGMENLKWHAAIPQQDWKTWKEWRRAGPTTCCSLLLPLNFSTNWELSSQHQNC